MINYRKWQFVAGHKHHFVLLFALIISTATISVCKAAHVPLTNAVLLRVADTVKNDTVYTKADKQPNFPGGGEAYLKFINKNMKYPEVMHDRQIEDNVVVQFIVEKEGSLSHFKALNSPGYGSAEEAVRLLKLSPKWIPAYKNNQPVRLLYKAPVPFKLKYIQHKGDNDGFKVITE